MKLQTAILPALITLALTTAVQAKSKVDIIHDRLENAGYSKIKFKKTSYPYVVRACRNGNKYELTYNKKPRLKGRETLGACKNKHIAKLDRFIDDYVPDRLRDRDRDFRKQKRHNGKAKHRGIPMWVILDELRDRGYRRLRVRDGELPGYKIKACKNGRKFLLGVNRWGGIKWREPRGHCFRFRNFSNYWRLYYN